MSVSETISLLRAHCDANSKRERATFSIASIRELLAFVDDCAATIRPFPPLPSREVGGKASMSRELLGAVVDDVFGGAIEDPSVIEDIYASIKRHEAALSTDAEPVAFDHQNYNCPCAHPSQCSGECVKTAPAVAVKDAGAPDLLLYNLLMEAINEGVAKATDPAWTTKDFGKSPYYQAIHAALSAQVQDVAGTVEAFDREHPEFYWHIAKGKITAGEPLFGAIITDLRGNELGDGESNISAIDAFSIAVEDAGLPVLRTQVQDAAEERYRHKKRGSTYAVIARGRLQVDGDLDNEKVVIYRGDDGQTWVRPEYEFNDGRFEALPSFPASEQSDAP